MPSLVDTVESLGAAVGGAFEKYARPVLSSAGQLVSAAGVLTFVVVHVAHADHFASVLRELEGDAAKAVVVLLGGPYVCQVVFSAVLCLAVFMNLRFVSVHDRIYAASLLGAVVVPATLLCDVTELAVTGTNASVLRNLALLGAAFSVCPTVCQAGRVFARLVWAHYFLFSLAQGSVAYSGSMVVGAQLLPVVPSAGALLWLRACVPIFARNAPAGISSADPEVLLTLGKLLVMLACGIMTAADNATKDVAATWKFWKTLIANETALEECCGFQPWTAVVLALRSVLDAVRGQAPAAQS